MNKRGNIAFNVLMWFFKIFFVIIVLFAVVLLIRSFIITELDIFNAEADIFVQKILMSRNGISYTDPDLDRVYPGIIDKVTFESFEIESLLNTSIYYGKDNKKIAANITLKNDAGNTIRSIVYNKNQYHYWKVLLEASWISGPGGVRSKTKQFNVLIKDQDSIQNGFLIIEVIIPNS